MVCRWNFYWSLVARILAWIYCLGIKRLKVRVMISLTESEYIEACNNYQGICLACEALQDGVEPDAEGYECESCGEHKVTGIEEALLMGELDIS